MGKSKYYVSTKGGGRGSAKCLRLLMRGGGGHTVLKLFLFLFGNIHVLRKHNGGREGVSQMLTFAYVGGGGVKTLAYVSIFIKGLSSKSSGNHIVAPNLCLLS